MKVRVERAVWRSGELEILLTGKEEEAVMEIAHTLGHYLSIIVGCHITEDHIVALWELRCIEPKGCYLCVRLPTDKSVCLDASDPDVVKRVLRKVMKQLDEIKTKEVLPIIEKVKEYVRGAIGDE